jgi:hypothetical protein
MFPASWHLLQQESFLIRSCLLEGFNELIKADINNNLGSLYTSFFHLSIGIERLLKVIIILDHMRNNSLQPPKATYLKKYSHNILSLIKECDRIRDDIGLSGDILFNQSKIKQDILSHLSNFSMRLRYHNIDALSSKPSGLDPLESWRNIITTVYRNEVPQKRQDRMKNLSSFLDEKLTPMTHILHHGLAKQELTIQSGILEQETIKESSPRIIWHYVEILNAINLIQFKLADDVLYSGNSTNNDTPTIPFVHEFYEFLAINRQDALKKKRWP